MPCSLAFGILASSYRVVASADIVRTLVSRVPSISAFGSTLTAFVRVVRSHHLGHAHLPVSLTPAPKQIVTT
jgi:hypothetical protein